ncbi:MAG: DUF1080 domain-containing protein [Planctomycetia bacterium]|nr:DUF1080 domain-containing protein [Planctomycetia bacterium]
MKKILFCWLAGLSCCGILSGAQTCPDRTVPEGFVSLFDGKTLDGWDGDAKFWSVQEGCIVGHSTPENVVPHNSFLILRQFEKPYHFELRVDFKMSKNANSGLSFRAQETASKPWNILGRHADIYDNPKHLATLYHNGVLAWRGQKVELNAQGKPEKVETFADAKDLLEKIDLYGWNQFRILVEGRTYTLWINDVKMAEVTENASVQPPQGVLGFQMHQGPPMTIQLKNIFFREIKEK